MRVNGQFEIRLDIAGVTKQTKAPDLREFEMIEVAGIGLPMFKGVLVCYDSHIRALFHEGSRLIVKYSDDHINEPNWVDTSIIITNTTVTRTDHSYNIAFTGLYDAMNYLVEHKQRSIRDKSALEAIMLVARDHFSRVDTNIPKSEDRMVWLQPAVPDKKFIADTWMYADLPDSFPMLGITVDGRFMIRDMATLIHEKRATPKWEFLPNVGDGSDPKKIWYNGDYVVNSNSGFMNHWLGYGNTLDVRDLELGEYEEVLEHTPPQLTKASSFARNAGADGRRGTPQWLTDNEHPRYWHAYQQNTTQLALYSTVSVTLNYDDKLHHDMRLFDMVYFREAQSARLGVDNPFSGLYVISKLSRKFTDNGVTTSVELSRETLADISGEVR